MENPNQTQPTLPVKAIVVVPGHNPRTRFDEPEMLELIEMIIAMGGLLQPILVRLVNGIYELIAGERRLRAWIRIYGEDSSIPVYIRTLDDETTAAGSIIENIGRAQMSEVEEAEGAAKILGMYLGDRAVTAKRLGWSPAMLDSRLALMHATVKVRAALQSKKIFLGHAELLAACRHESQDAALDHLLKQEKMMAVGELKAYLEFHALVLDTAIFEKTDCAACHHSSVNQASLFAEAISGGRCTNKHCFDAKTEAEIIARVAVLKDEYQVVRIVRPGENLTVIPLVAEGPKGVGQEQATACKVCKDFGAVVSTVPDKLGRVYKGLCMNVPCNTLHVAAKLKAEKDAEKELAAKAGGNQAPAGSKADPSAKAPDAKAASTTKTAPKVAASSEPSNRVKEYREKLWRRIFERAVAKLAVADNRMVLMALCLTNPSVINRSAISKALEPLVTSTVTKGPAEVLSDISNLDQAQLGSALNHIAASVNAEGHALAIKDVIGILKFFEIKIENYWKVDKSLIELLTKNEIDAVCEEIGIKTAMGADYAKLRNGSKDEFIAAVTAVKDFDYRGRIPKLVSY